jgi:hypothetical protein
MASQTRIYHVMARAGGEEFLVRAANRAQALGHVTRTIYVAEVASQEQLLQTVGRGVKVEDAGADPQCDIDDVPGVGPSRKAK